MPSPPEPSRRIAVRLASDGPRLVDSDADLEWRELPGGPWHLAPRISRFEDTIELVNRIGRIEVGGRQLRHRMRHRGVPLWQFLPSHVWPELFRARELCVALLELIDRLAPAALEAEVGHGPSASIWRGVAGAVAAERGLPLTVSRRSRRRRRPNVRAIAGPFLGTPVELALRAARAAAGRGRRPAPPRGGPVVLYGTIARHAGPRPYSDELWDEQLSPLLPLLGARGWGVVAVDCPYGPRRSAARATRQRAEAMPEVVWTTFERWSRLRAMFSPAHQLRWWRLARDPGFQAGFEAGGVSLWEAVRRPLRRSFTVFAPEAAALLDTAARILRDQRPSVVVCSYESGPYQRALLVEAARSGIPSVGLQHGMIFSNHYDYLHEAVDPGGLGTEGFTVPDVTCVWGSLWADVLVDRGSYPADAVAVTGSWRHDALAALDDASSAAHGVAAGQQVGLVLPGGFDVVGFVADSIEACRAVGLAPLVKLHPADDPAPVRALLAQMGLHPDTLVEGRLVESLRRCALVITAASTVAAEALLYDRPVVLFASLRHAGAEAYLSSGACLHAEDVDGLTAALTEALSPERAGTLAHARQAFVERAFGPRDGGAPGRVVALLERLASTPG